MCVCIHIRVELWHSFHIKEMTLLLIISHSVSKWVSSVWTHNLRGTLTWHRKPHICASMSEDVCGHSGSRRRSNVDIHTCHYRNSVCFSSLAETSPHVSVVPVLVVTILDTFELGSKMLISTWLASTVLHSCTHIKTTLSGITPKKVCLIAETGFW